MRIRNLYRDRDGLVAVDEQGDHREVGPAERYFYARGERRPRGVRAERAGQHWRIYQPIKSGELPETHARYQRAGYAPLEMDVNSVERALADVAELRVAQTFRYVILDIETADDGTPATDHAALRVISCAVRGSDGRRDWWRAEDESPAAEAALLRAIARRMAEYDVLCAWNGGKEWGDDGFDFPVLRERMRALGIAFDWWRAQCLDLLHLFRRHFLVTTDGGERQSFALAAVGRSLLGKTKAPLKEQLRGRGIDPGRHGMLAAYRAAPDLLEEYNRRDVDLCWEVEEKTQFLALHFSLCALCNCLPRGDSLTPTRQMDALMLRLGAQSDYHWPTRAKGGYENPWADRKVGGAAVMAVVPGLSEGVSVLDVAALYPSLIRALNLGIDTKDPNGPIAPVMTDKTGRPTDQVIARFASHDRLGQVPLALETVLARRAEFDGKMKGVAVGSPEHADLKRLSNACKVVANSMYGILLQPGSRFYDPDVGESVTSTGRLLIRAVVDCIEAAGHRVILQDTDSAAFACGPDDAPRLIAEINERVFAEALGRIGVPAGVARARLSIKYEERYRRLLQVRTKGYAGTFEVYRGVAAAPDAPPDIKGLECVRGDVIAAARKLQRTIVERILAGESSAWCRRHAEEVKTAFLAGELPMEDVLVFQAITKPLDEYKSAPPHVRAAREMVARGLPLEGDKVSYWVARGNTVRLPEDWDPHQCDWDGYWNSDVWAPTQAVLDVAFPGEDWDLSTRPKQSPLLGAEPKKIRRAAVDERAPVVVRVQFEGALSPRDKQRIQRIDEAARAHPGECEFVVELEERGKGHVTVLTMGHRVAASARRALLAAAAPVDSPQQDLFAAPIIGAGT